MLIDSNLIIYASKPEYSTLRTWIQDNLPKVSIITWVEVLGYHRLTEAEKTALAALFESLDILYPTPFTFKTAVQLRQQRKLSLGDSLIAATAIEHGLTLATHNTVDFVWIENLALADPLKH